MNLACNSANMVEKLIVVDIAPKAYSMLSHEELLKNIIHTEKQGFTSREDAKEKLLSSIKDVKTTLFLLKSLYQKEDNTYGFRFDATALLKNLHSYSSAIDQNAVFDGDTLFIKGEKSDYITDNDTQAIETHFPHSHISVMKNAGHWVHVDANEDFSRAILKFLLG